MGDFEEQTVTISSWEDAQDKLFMGAWQPNLNRYRPSHAFRGLSEAYDTLPTSLIRLGQQNSDGTFNASHGAEVESDVLRNFIKYAEDRSLSDKSIWHQLSVAQHYGLPTRILDWTYSPLVALHFATENMSKLDEDGLIWRVDIDEAHALLNDTWTEEKSGHVFTIDELTEVASDFDDPNAIFEQNETDSPLFFEPPSLDGRIVNQFALFSVLPDPTQRFDQWLADHRNIFKRYRIPASVKMEIRDKLDASNITERVLFPGLDGLAEWLQRYYTPVRETETQPP